MSRACSDPGSSLLLLLNWYEGGEEGGDEVIAEVGGVGDAVDVGALRAEVRVRQVVEHHHPEQEEHQDDWHGHRQEAELLQPVPLAQGDVRHKDEGGKDAKDESPDLGEVVDVRQRAQNCRETRKKKQTL